MQPYKKGGTLEAPDAAGRRWLPSGGLGGGDGRTPRLLWGVSGAGMGPRVQHTLRLLWGVSAQAGSYDAFLMQTAIKLPSRTLLQ